MHKWSKSACQLNNRTPLYLATRACLTPARAVAQFVFVSQQNTDCRPTRKEKCPVEGTEPLVPLAFEKMKAISYPGGDRYKVYDECEQNEFAEGC